MNLQTQQMQKLDLTISSICDSSDEYNCSCDTRDFRSVCITCQLLICDYCLENDHKKHNNIGLKKLKTDINKLAKSHIIKIQECIQQFQNFPLLYLNSFSEQLKDIGDKWVQIDSNTKQLTDNQNKTIIQSVLSYVDLDRETNQLLNQIEKTQNLSISDQIHQYYNNTTLKSHSLDQNTFNIYIDAVVKTIIPDLIKNAVEQVTREKDLQILELKQQHARDIEKIQSILQQTQLQQQKYKWKKLSLDMSKQYIVGSKEMFGVCLFTLPKNNFNGIIELCQCGLTIFDIYPHHQQAYQRRNPHLLRQERGNGCIHVCQKALIIYKIFIINVEAHCYQQILLGNNFEDGVKVTLQDLFYDLPNGLRINIRDTYHKLANGDIIRETPDKKFFDSSNKMINQPFNLGTISLKFSGDTGQFQPTFELSCVEKSGAVKIIQQVDYRVDWSIKINNDNPLIQLYRADLL